MEKQQLLERLRELQNELHQADSPDAEERAELQKLAGEIQTLLDQPETSGSFTGLGQRLEAAALRLEATHPRATMLIGRTIDLLVQMGI